MNKIVLLFSALFFVAACKKDNLTVTFTTDHEFDFIIEKTTILNLPFNVPTPDVEVNHEGKYEANDTRVDRIQEATLNYLNLEIKDPPSETFSFLKDIYLYIKADGQSEVLFASKENIDNSTQKLELDINDVDFAPYLKAGDFSVRTQVVLDESLAKDVTVTTSFEFRIVSKVLN